MIAAGGGNEREVLIRLGIIADPSAKRALQDAARGVKGVEDAHERAAKNGTAAKEREARRQQSIMERQGQQELAQTERIARAKERYVQESLRRQSAAQQAAARQQQALQEAQNRRTVDILRQQDREAGAAQARQRQADAKTMAYRQQLLMQERAAHRVGRGLSWAASGMGAMAMGAGMLLSDSEGSEKQMRRIITLVGAYELLRGGLHTVKGLHSAWMSYQQAVLAAARAHAMLAAAQAAGGLTAGGAAAGTAAGLGTAGAGAAGAVAGSLIGGVPGFLLRHSFGVSAAASAAVLGYGAWKARKPAIEKEVPEELRQLPPIVAEKMEGIQKERGLESRKDVDSRGFLQRFGRWVWGAEPLGFMGVEPSGSSAVAKQSLAIDQRQATRDALRARMTAGAMRGVGYEGFRAESAGIFRPDVDSQAQSNWRMQGAVKGALGTPGGVTDEARLQLEKQMLDLTKQRVDLEYEKGQKILDREKNKLDILKDQQQVLEKRLKGYEETKQNVGMMGRGAMNRGARAIDSMEAGKLVSAAEISAAEALGLTDERSKGLIGAAKERRAEASGFNDTSVGKRIKEAAARERRALGEVGGAVSKAENAIANFEADLRGKLERDFKGVVNDLVTSIVKTMGDIAAKKQQEGDQKGATKGKQKEAVGG